MFKNQLKLYRKQNGLSQQEVANKLATTQQAYSYYENGTREPNIDTLKKLCIIFNCSADELLELDSQSDRKRVVINHSFNNSKNIKFNA